MRCLGSRASVKEVVREAMAVNLQSNTQSAMSSVGVG